MAIKLLGSILAGLGLFFAGIKLLSSSMQQLASARLRQLINRTASRPIVSRFLGVMGGFLMQKPSGVIAILTSMQANGLINLRQAMPIVAWCNVGMALLAFFVVIPISTLVAYILGITGFLMMFCTNRKRVTTVTAVFGAALLFYGLEEMKRGTGDLRSFAWFQQTVLWANASPMVALIVGALVAAITQSFIAIAIMAVSLVGTGALGAPQAMMVIYGANFGVGFFRRLMTASMTGEAKQLFIYQNFFRYLGTGGSVLLFYAVPVHGKPVMLYLAELVTADVGTQLALIFLACNLPAVLIGSLFDERLLKLLVKLSPPTIEDELSRLKYLATASADDPAVAIGQLEAELAARVGKLPDYIESLRDEKPTQATPEILQESGQRIGTEMSSFAHELMSQRLTVEERGHLSLVVNELTLVRMLEDSLYDAACLVRDGLGESREAFGGRAWVILEALHSQLVTLGEAIDSGDVECLERITTDKGRVLDEFRRTCLESATTTPPAAQETFSKLISHFEYVVWTIHRLANLLRRVRAYHSGRTGA